MPDFEYTARELTGKEVTGVLTASSEQEVVNSLSTRALFPIRIDLAATEEVKRRRSRKRVRSAQLATFYSQLADLLRAGVPLLRSLEILEQQSTRSGLNSILQDVREEVAEGTRLADAMRVHQRVFGELAISMVRAGEEGGFLEDVLKRIAQFTEHQEELKSRVLGALVYPLFLMGMGALIVTGMLVFFVPKFAPIFDRMSERGELPIPTTILMGFSNIMQAYGLWILGILIAGVWWLVRFSATSWNSSAATSTK